MALFLLWIGFLREGPEGTGWGTRSGGFLGYQQVLGGLSGPSGQALASGAHSSM